MGEKYSKLKAVIQSSIVKMIRQDVISDEEYANLISIYPIFEVGKNYLVNDTIRYSNELYEVIQAHTSQSDWTPDVTLSLFKKVVPEGVIPVWVQPTGAHDAYHIGDKVIFDGKIYESTVDNNVWAPNVYGWILL